MNDEHDWTGQRILIIGAARQGLALARYLARHGAAVTLNDQRPAEKLQAACAGLAGLPVAWVLGGHPLELLDQRRPGLPLRRRSARPCPSSRKPCAAGCPLTNDSQIFMEAVPCPVIGITGSAGKTTTTTLVGRMAQAAVAGCRARAWVGGNIGQPLIDHRGRDAARTTWPSWSCPASSWNR